MQSREGGLAQLARASALHAEGQRFESVILHKQKESEQKGNHKSQESGQGQKIDWEAAM